MEGGDKEKQLFAKATCQRQRWGQNLGLPTNRPTISLLNTPRCLLRSGDAPKVSGLSGRDRFTIEGGQSGHKGLTV